MRKNLLILLSGVLLTGMLSCTSEPAAEPESTDMETRALPVDPGNYPTTEHIDFDYHGGSVYETTRRQHSDPSWEVISDPGWIDVILWSYTDEITTFLITAHQNYFGYRSGDLVIRHGAAYLEISVAQAGSRGGSPLDVLGLAQWYYNYFQPIDLGISVNEPYRNSEGVEIEIDSISEWLKVINKSPIILDDKTDFKTAMSFEMDENKSELDREGMVVLKFTIGGEVFYQSIRFKQSGNRKDK